MNRGKFSPLSLFALSLWGAVFFSGALPGVLLLTLGFAWLAVAVTIFRVENVRWKQASLALGFLGLGLLVGGLRIPESPRWDRYPPFFARPASYTPIPLDRIGEFRGIMSADSSSVPTSDGVLSRYPLRLEQVVSSDRLLQGSASGNVLVLVRGGQVLFQGQEITVYSGLVPSREPGRFAYVSRAKPQQLQVGGFRRRFSSFRAGVFAAVQGKIQELEPSVASLLTALLLGRKEELQSSLYDQFRTSGSLHLLALSGLHLGILYFFLALLLRFLRDRRLRRLVAGVLLLGYVLLVGLRPSLERAVMVLLFAGLGYALDREPQPLNLLGLAAALLLILRPYYAFDLSFQLSFLSLAAIILLGPYLYRLWQPYLPAFLGWPLGISLSAQIGTAPLVLFHFGVVYPVGILAAVLLIPLVTLFLGTGLLFVGLSMFPISLGSFPLSGWIGEGLFLLYRMIVFCLECFSRVPGLYLSWRSLYWGFPAVLLIPRIIEQQVGRGTRLC